MDNPSSNKYVILNSIVLLVYMAAIFVLSVRPAPESVPGLWQMDKLMHGAAYAIMGLLALRATVGRRRAGSVQRAALYAFLISFVFGVFIEVAQTFTAARQGSVFDAIANGVGAYVGVYILGRFIARRSSGKK
jgi:VanZ family protein